MRDTDNASKFPQRIPMEFAEHIELIAADSFYDFFHDTTKKPSHTREGLNFLVTHHGIEP